MKDIAEEDARAARQIKAVDVVSRDGLRMLHLAGTLTFSREKSTLLEVGLIKIEPGETATEDGFDCHAEFPTPPTKSTPKLPSTPPPTVTAKQVQANYRKRQKLLQGRGR